MTTRARKKTVPSTNPRAPLNIFLVGDLGAGKATQSALLRKEFPLYDFDFGKEQAHLRAKDKALDEYLSRTVDVGKMTPTSVYRKVVKEVLAKVPVQKGMLFDGGPKAPAEVLQVARWMRQNKRTRNICIYLSVPWKETVRRNRKRKGYFGSKKRADDDMRAIKNRYTYVQSKIHQARPVYKSLYPFAAVSGIGSVQEVHERVLKAIDRLIRKLEIEN